MKGRYFSITLSAILFSSAALLQTVKAETFCVSTAEELQAALTFSQSNRQDDTIRIVQGTYSGNFTYESTETFHVNVEGGYRVDCGSRVVSAENTVLEGTASAPCLALTIPGNIRVEGITLENGIGTVNDGEGGLVVLTGNASLVKNGNTPKEVAANQADSVKISDKSDHSMRIKRLIPLLVYLRCGGKQ